MDTAHTIGEVERSAQAATTGSDGGSDAWGATLFAVEWGAAQVIGEARDAVGEAL